MINNDWLVQKYSNNYDTQLEQENLISRNNILNYQIILIYKSNYYLI
jgi:hypothetical protein